MAGTALESVFGSEAGPSGPSVTVLRQLPGSAAAVTERENENAAAEPQVIQGVPVRHLRSAVSPVRSRSPPARRRKSVSPRRSYSPLRYEQDERHERRSDEYERYDKYQRYDGYDSDKDRYNEQECDPPVSQPGWRCFEKRLLALEAENLELKRGRPLEGVLLQPTANCEVCPG